MMHGSIPTSLLECFSLERIDVSRNGFDGKIPSGLVRLQNLTTINFEENSFTGSIPVQLFQLSKLSHLQLHTNLLTGSIPHEVGNAMSIEVLTLNHNSLQDKIPSELRQLKNIKRIHLQHNQLTGDAPDMKEQKLIYPDFEYRSDCGNPSFLLKKELKCDSCTICCNSLDLCQANVFLGLPVHEVNFITTFSFLIVTSLIWFAVSQLKKMGFFEWLQDHRSPLSIYSKDSVYCLIFSDSILAWFIYAFTVGVQTCILVLFLLKSNFNDDDTDWAYTMRCPGNREDCITDAGRTAQGWFLFSAITIIFTASDLLDSTWQLRKAFFLRDIRLFISGVVLCYLTSMTLVTSFFYNLALATSDTELLANAVILLFVNDIDEQFLIVIDSMVPEFMSKRYDEILKNLSKKTSSLSESHLRESNTSRRRSTSSNRFIDVIEHSDIDVASNDSFDIDESGPLEKLSRYEQGMKILGFKT